MIKHLLNYLNAIKLKFMLNKKQTAGIKANLGADDTAYPLAFQALGDPCRFKVFKVLMEHHNICVTDVANIFGITVSAASQQLRILERLGLARKIRKGQMVCYEVNNKDPVAKNLSKLLSTK